MNNLSNLRRNSNGNLPQGGQASISLFGLPGSSSVRRRTPAPASAAPTSLHLRTDRFQAFVRLSEREQRPVEEIMGEWLADCANLIQKSDFADVYGDARPSTPAMRRAADAADARERSTYVDDEEAIREHAALGAGYVNITLAMEGN